MPNDIKPHIDLKVGVLALQGCITPHISKLNELGVTAIKVTKLEDFNSLDGLIFPGGESTTMLKLANVMGLTEVIKNTVTSIPCWGICAGSILLAEEVVNPSQFSFKALPIRATRNAYGSQLDSFKTSVEVNLGENNSNEKTQIPIDFIRAPKLEPLNDSVEVLAYNDSDPVMLRYKNCLTTSFHTELTELNLLHQYFLNICKEFVLSAKNISDKGEDRFKAKGT